MFSFLKTFDVKTSYERRYRKILLKSVYGKVLEINVGSSNNMSLYDKGKVETLIGTDYSLKALEKALEKKQENKFQYQLQDSENLDFEDNTFDSVVDTFGLDFCYDPEKAIQEMKRVCKNDGHIYILEKGLTGYSMYDKYLNWIFPHVLVSEGRFNNRNWEEIIEKKNQI